MNVHNIIGLQADNPGDHATVAKRNRWILKAGIAAVMAFAGLFLALTVFVLALIGLDQLRQPVAFGLWGPSLASELVRLGLAVSALLAAAVFAAMVFYGLMDLRNNQPTTASETLHQSRVEISLPASTQTLRFGSYGLFANGDVIAAVGPQHVMIGGQVQPITAVATRPGFLGWHHRVPEDHGLEDT